MKGETSKEQYSVVQATAYSYTARLSLNLFIKYTIPDHFNYSILCKNFEYYFGIVKFEETPLTL